MGDQGLMEQEACMMAAVSHAHVLPAFAVLAEPRLPGQAYLVMQKTGDDLYTCLLQRRYTLSWPCPRQALLP